jgi:hypothetical protein
LVLMHLLLHGWKKDDKFVLVFKNYQNFLIFYKFYVWLIIHFEFGLNIYLLFDDKNYKNSESFQRIANLMSKLVWNMTAVVLIYSKAEFWHKLIESVSKLKYINNNENTNSYVWNFRLVLNTNKIITRPQLRFEWFWYSLWQSFVMQSFYSRALNCLKVPETMIASMFWMRFFCSIYFTHK